MGNKGCCIRTVIVTHNKECEITKVTHRNYKKYATRTPLNPEIIEPGASVLVR